MKQKTCSASDYRQDMAKYKGKPSNTDHVLKKKNKSEKIRFTLDSIGNEFLKKIIEQVKQKPLLWDKRHKLYANNLAKNKEWKEIDENLMAEIDKMVEEGTMEEDEDVRPIDSHYTFGLLVKKFKREESEIKRQLSGSSPRKSNWALYEDMKFASAASDDTSFRKDLGISDVIEQPISSQNLTEEQPTSIQNVTDELERFDNYNLACSSSSTMDYFDLMSRPEIQEFVNLPTETTFNPTWRKPNKKSELLMQPIQELKKTMDKLMDLRKERVNQCNSNDVLAQHLKLIGLRIGALKNEGQQRVLKVINDVLFHEEAGIKNCDLSYYVTVASNADPSAPMNTIL